MEDGLTVFPKKLPRVMNTIPFMGIPMSPYSIMKVLVNVVLGDKFP